MNLFKMLLLLFPLYSLAAIAPKVLYKKALNESENNFELPQNFKVDSSVYNVKYTLNKKLEEKIQGIFRRYRPDYGAVVVIDNDNGDILSAVDYTRQTKSFGRQMCFSSTHPAASIFKVITAASLIQKDNIDSETEFSYRGKGVTLYKYQLKDKVDRWSRNIKLENAFAYSNNVVLAKAAIKESSAEELFNMANKFKFNTDLLDIFPVEPSVVELAKDKYSLAEIASGFNRRTLMSPLHGAVIASIVANDGVYKKVSLVSEISNRQESDFWISQRKNQLVLDKQSISELQKMMELTVEKGTARSIGRASNRGVLKHLVLGGKTGTITGGEPYGKRDWFVIYAKPKYSELGNGISVAVMLVNLKKWYIKSTWLAQNLIEYYYQNLFPFKNESQMRTK